MLFASRQQNPGLIAKWLSDSIPGMLLLLFWANFVKLFSFERFSFFTSNKYSDKLHYILLIFSNGVIVYYSSYSGIGQFDLSSLQICSGLVAFFLYYIMRTGDLGLIGELDIEKGFNNLSSCPACKSAVYLRSYHDPIVNHCIFRYDSYNSYTKCVIGLKNYRSFIFFLFVQTFNVLLILTHSYQEMRWSWSYGTLFDAFFLTIFHLFTLYFFLALFQVSIINIYKMLSNITTHEIVHYRELSHVSMDPYYDNMFDQGWSSNIKNFLTGYRAEREQWEQKAFSKSSREFIGSFLNAGKSQEVQNEDLDTNIDQNDQSIDIINAWLNQTNQSKAL